MAFDEKAQWVTLHYEVDETVDGKIEKVVHGFRMKYGTALALGLKESDLSVGFKKVQVDGYPVRRRLYPGGPMQEIVVPAKQRYVAVGPRSGRARTNKKMILKGNGANKEATIYYSGPLQAAVAFLKAKTSVDGTLFGNSMQLLSPRGRALVIKTGND